MNRVVLILLAAVATIASAQSSVDPSKLEIVPQVRPALPQLPLQKSREQGADSREITHLQGAPEQAKTLEDTRLEDKPHKHGYWFDTSTGLVWAGGDNGVDMDWRQATNYCRDLSLGGYSNWRLARIDELQGIYDDSTNASLPLHTGKVDYLTGRAKGGLFLTGSYYWSSSLLNGDHKNAGDDVWEFDFLHGNRHNDRPNYSVHIRALCVRRSDVSMVSQSTTEGQGLVQETQSRGYWLDHATGLMWAERDNGKEVTWRNARRYCRDLRIAGYSDWRLASLDELATLVDNSAQESDSGSDSKIFSINLGHHVRGNLYLTGDSWSSNRPLDRFHHPYNDGYFFDFRASQPSYDLQLFRNTKRVLCVRRPAE